MAWYKVDDKLHSHPKARRAGLAAMGLWSLAGSHCMDYLTDGIVEAWFVDSWPDGRRLADKLVTVGLWDEHPDGWAFHDWRKYQPTAEAVKEKRSARSEAGRKGAEKRWADKPMANGMANAIANECDSNAPSPVPSPSPITTKTSKSPSRNTPPDSETDASAAAVLRGLNIAPERLVTHIESRTSRRVTPTGALRVAAALLDKVNGSVRTTNQQYVLGSITRSPAEVQQFIDENGLAS